jgi:hypothetical protein
MKKRIIILLFILSASSLTLFASFHLGLSAGYSYASMDDMKNGFQTMKNAAEARTMTAQIGNFGSSVFGNIDIDFGLNDLLSIGPRTGVQYVLPVDVNVTDTLDPLITVKDTYSAVLVPLMAGVNFNIKTSALPLQLTLGAYCGYGLAFMSKTENATFDPVLPGDVTYFNSIYQGGGIMYETSGAVEIFINEYLTLSVNLGYRVAKFNNLKAVDKIDVAGYTIIPPGQLLTDGTGETRSADFSGFNGGLGLNLRF